MSKRDARGRFVKGASGNPGGRPSRADQLRQLLDGDAEHVAQKVIEAAKEGDLRAAELVLSRCAPVRRPTHEPVHFEIDETAPLAEQGRAVMAAVAAGQIAPDQGRSLMDAIASLARVVEVDDIARRLAELEERTE